MLRNYTNIGARATLILGVLVFLAYAFVMRSDAAGSTFATGSGQGGLEMKIDSTTYYNGVHQPALSWSLKNLVPGVDRFFNFGDVKPGDRGTNTISIHIKKNPAYVCLDFVNLTNKENGMNEPESQVDATPAAGELASGLEFFAWRDDGDNKFEIGEKPLFGTSTQSGLSVMGSTTYALADKTHGTPFASNSTHYVGIAWCAGDLVVNVPLAKISCNGAVLGNEAQTDSMGVDVRIRAVQSSVQPRFLCVPEKKKECKEDHHDDDDRDDKKSSDKDKKSVAPTGKVAGAYTKGGGDHDDDDDEDDDACDHDDDDRDDKGDDRDDHKDDKKDDSDWHETKKNTKGKQFVEYCKKVVNRFRS